MSARDKEVNNRSHDVCQQDKDEPAYLDTAPRFLRKQAVGKHPYPEDCRQYSKCIQSKKRK